MASRFGWQEAAGLLEGILTARCAGLKKNSQLGGSRKRTRREAVRQHPTLTLGAGTRPGGTLQRPVGDGGAGSMGGEYGRITLPFQTDRFNKHRVGCMMGSHKHSRFVMSRARRSHGRQGRRAAERKSLGRPKIVGRSVTWCGGRTSAKTTHSQQSLQCVLPQLQFLPPPFIAASAMPRCPSHLLMR